MLSAHLAFRCKSLDKIYFHFALCKPSDAGTPVPAPKFHTRPGYINTHILTALTCLQWIKMTMIE